MDFQTLLHVQCKGKSQRHMNRVTLMFKASEINVDKTALLMANNPLPDLSKLNGGESPAKYLAENVLRKAWFVKALD